MALRLAWLRACSDVIYEFLALPLPVLVVTALAILPLLAWFSRGRGPRIPSCDFEAFYWKAKQRLGRKFDSIRHGNRVSADGVDRFAWAVPNKQSLACIARYIRSLPEEHRHIVDFGAGAGYWSLQVHQFSHIMALEGVRMTALDLHPELYPGKTWYPIEKGDIEALGKLTDAGMLLLVWPPCWEDMGMKAVKAFRGNLVAYVGEARGGATAWHSFFDTLEEGWDLVEEVEIPNWHGRSDHLFIYKRRTCCPQDAVKEAGALKPSSVKSPGELLLPFYRSQGRDVEGRSMVDIRKTTFAELQLKQTWVQWLFPTDEESMFYLEAPLLTRNLQKLFCEDAELRNALRLNLAFFCGCLGLELQGSTIVMGSDFQARVPHCWSSMFGGNPNWLRISRVLHCLGLCNFPPEQASFLAVLEEILQKGLAQCDSALPHWRQRAKMKCKIR